jgi:excinuclease ABC subunit C
MSRKFQFEFDPKQYPLAPGCYLMKDAGGQVLYVGKAKCLRRRLSSYFGKSWHPRRIRQLVAEVCAIEVILVTNETESLVLENNLIKQHKPPYNRMLVRDDSGYGYILKTGERFPRFVIYRRHRLSKALGSEDEDHAATGKRYGPYVSKHFRDTLLDFVNAHYGLRTCKTLPGRVCLQYHIGKCSGICAGLVTPEQYAESVRQAEALLACRSADVIPALKRQMLEHAARLEFEKAQKLKVQIHALEVTLKKQVVDRDVRHDQDVVYFGERAVMLARVERGILRDAGLFDLDLSAGYEQACRAFLLSFYAARGGEVGNAIDRELIVNQLADAKAVAAELSRELKCRIRITFPRRGPKHDLLRLCEQNYNYRTRFQE